MKPLPFWEDGLAPSLPKAANAADPLPGDLAAEAAVWAELHILQ
jgi:hypothetical protein